ncbi:hypothetical protein BCD67_19335 [Oscillatoriales cyanobacterium USR001]|nr:hypothetical protein BCD67_19335 [Oscillatoriales cyanobacterium USR001]
MNLEQAVLDKLRELPPDKQQEVLDFAEFLQQKSLTKKPLKSVKGMWADLKVDITEEDIKLRGERTGEEDIEDNYERYGLYFSEPIGYILKADGNRIPLNYGEIKIKKTTGKYHVIPRTKPRTSY